MIGRLFRSTVVLVLAALVTLAPVAPAYGQQQPSDKPETPQNVAPPPSFRLVISQPDYAKGPSQFPNIVRPYSPIRVPPPELTNSPRIGQLIQDGKLQLSLQDAIALALENNLDIAIQRYTPWIAETDILRALAGGALRGASGIGTEALGFIPAQTFDPQVTWTSLLNHQNIPVNNPFISGTGRFVPNVIVHSVQDNLSYSQSFHTGTGFAVSSNNTRTSSTSPATTFNPSIQSTLFVSFTQQLLNGWGPFVNTRFIRIAKNNKRIGDLAFAQQVITSVVQVADAYWELVFAREDVKVKQRALGVSEKLYSDNKRQVEIGTLAPIEIVRAEAEVASDRQNLIVAQTVQLQQQTVLLNAITKNPNDPALQGVEIIPTDAPTPPAQIEITPMQDALKEALSKRPDVLQAEVDLLNRDINIRATRNALLPVLSLFGQYGWTGLKGNSAVAGAATGAFTANANSPVVTAAGTPTGTFTSTPVLGPSTFVQSGLGDALGSIFGNEFPSYSVQLNLTIPIRNRAAQADSARALLEQRQAEARLRQLHNSVLVDVRNTQIALEQDRARVEAATKARILQEQTLDAEQKKFQLGASTIFFVIQAERDLANAADVELRALVDLVKAKIDFERALGRTIEVNHITIADAKSGHVERNTLIPGTINGEVIGPQQTY